MIISAKIVDITTLEVDVIVNPANPALYPGGGLSGAIHFAAGYELYEETKWAHPMGCSTGFARITGGHNLPAKHVIHTVGPNMNEINDIELGRKLLNSCYNSSFKLMKDNKLKSIAFPAISTGIYGFDPEQAAQMAVITAFEQRHKEDNTIEHITFACFDKETFNLYLKYMVA